MVIKARLNLNIKSESIHVLRRHFFNLSFNNKIKYTNKKRTRSLYTMRNVLQPSQHYACDAVITHKDTSTLSKNEDENMKYSLTPL
jgi:hypothetical protein